MAKKRRYNSKQSNQSIGSDIKDFSTALLGAAILLFLWLIAIIVQVIVSFWYVIGLVVLCCVVVWFKTRTPTPSIPTPSIKTIETVEDIATSHGSKKIKIVETYHEKHSPGIIQALINRL